MKSAEIDPRDSKGRVGCPTKSGRPPEQGFALVFTLLLLSLMSLMALAMVLSTSSDMFINGYYSNARGSFYAADSGLNIARQQLYNGINALVANGSTFSTPPITDPSGSTTTILNNVTSAWSSYQSLNSGQGANSWGGKFKITSATLNVTPTVSSYCDPSSASSCTSVPTSYSNYSLCTTANTYIANATGCTYTFQYSLTSVGMAQGSEQTTISESGSIIMAVTGSGSSTKRNFASYGAFIDKFPLCQKGALVPGTLTGPFFTNGAWEFGTSGTYTFTDTVGQANSQFGYWFGGSCVGSSSSKYQSGSQTIAPKFQGSPAYLLGQNTEALPANDYNQKWAVIDGIGTNTTSPTTSQMSSYLKTASGTAYTSSSTPGVYFNYTTSGSTSTLNGGGFYVEGDATVQLSVSGTATEVYTITQTSGSTTTTTTITTSPTVTSGGATCAGTTTVGTSVSTTSGWGWNKTTTTTTSSSTFSGVPCNNNSGAAATLLYVDGEITSLSGSGQGVAAVNDYNAITVVANGDVDITGDLLYKSEPVTTTATTSTPVDTLISGNDKGQVLGVFTANGDIHMSSSYSNSNLEIDASMAAISSGGSHGFQTDSNLNTVTNVGGRIENQANSVSINTMNVYFDRRFTTNVGFAPPWFPSTTVTTTGPTSATTTVSQARSQWLLKNM